MSLQLDPQAVAFIQQLQKHTGPITSQMQTVIEQAAQAQQATPAPAAPAQGGAAAPATSAPAQQKPLSLDETYKLVLQALPDNDYAKQVKKVIDGCKTAAQTYDCGGGKCGFLSQIIDMKIVKERDEVYSPPAPARPVIRDPLYASFNMAPNADFMLLFNARDVDRNGQPLLMKIIKRKSADINEIDLSKYRTAAGWQRDIVEVADNADVVRTADVHDDEFDFGDPLKQVSLCGKGKELSTSVMICRTNELQVNYYYGKTVNGAIVPDPTRFATRANPQAGEQLDNRAVVSFTDRIRLTLAAGPQASSANWLNDSFAAYKSSIELDRGLIFEPNAQADVVLGGVTTNTAVAANDAGLLGSPARSQPVTGSFSTLYQLLTSSINLTTYTKDAAGRPKADRQARAIPVSEVIYGLKDSISVAGATLAPLASNAVTAAEFAAKKLSIEKKPLCHDAEKNGQEVKLTLDKGFLTSKDPASVDGWKIMVGFTDEAGAWQDVGSRTVKGCESGKEEFTLQIKDAKAIHLAGRTMEVRVYNKDGVPAQRLTVAFDQVSWASSLRGGGKPDQS